MDILILTNQCHDENEQLKNIHFTAELLNEAKFSRLSLRLKAQGSGQGRGQQLKTTAEAKFKSTKNYTP